MSKNIVLTLVISLFAVTMGFTSCNGNSKKDTTSADSLLMDSAVFSVPDTGKQVTIADSSWAQAAQSLAKSMPAQQDTTKKPGKPALMPMGNMDPYRPQELLDGLNKAKNGDLRGAIVDFDKCIAKFYKNHNAHYYKAKAYIELNEPQNALSALNLAIEYNPNQPLYYYYRGELYAKDNNQGSAFADFDKAVSLDAKFVEALNYRGVTYEVMGKHTEAIVDYNAAIALKPEYATAYYNKGTSEAAMELYKDAIASFTKCIELDPEKTMSFMNRGNCYVMVNDYKSAISDYSKVISVSPESSDAYYNRGAAYQYAGDKKACDDWRKAQSLGNKRAGEMLSKYCK
jgi:tetratricopeptide (TPR) repeat protein